MISAEIYLHEIRANLPRLLALIDRDQTSQSYGMGDRCYWAWGLIDFGNATFQGMANGFARLWHHGLWPYRTHKSHFIERIDSLFLGAAKLTRSDGSLEEAFPREGSFCVTALVAFDLLVALDLLEKHIDEVTRKNWLDTIRPMVDFLLRAEETHATISNHLATAVAALVRWHKISGDALAEARARQLLNCILESQSEEGWFLEYQGADPGYQSLCTCYLADTHQLRPDWQLLEPLRKSVQFIWYFAHPDGSFGGIYGSRNTRFFYPAGLLALGDEIPEAAALAAFMAKSISSQRVVTLSSIDELNLVPTFNNYCWAAALASKSIAQPDTLPILPALVRSPMRLHYYQAGLVLDRGEDHYTIVATCKGGVVYHFVSGKQSVIDAGIVVRNNKGKLGSSQGNSQVEFKEEGGTLAIVADITPMPKMLPEPWHFLILRLMCFTVFRSPKLRECVKQFLVRLLITGSAPWSLKNRRTIQLGMDLAIHDETEFSAGYERVDLGHEFVPIHMASQGYWQLQDEEGI
jgi:hypothetical protein